MFPIVPPKVRMDFVECDTCAEEPRPFTNLIMHSVDHVLYGVGACLR